MAGAAIGVLVPHFHHRPHIKEREYCAPPFWIGFQPSTNGSGAVTLNQSTTNATGQLIVPVGATARINGGGAERLPNTTSIAFEFVEGEAILLLLSEHGICASSGSACTSGSLEPSHVLRAMGVPFTCAHGSIRFSLSRFTTDAEIDLVIRELPGIIRRLREMSPFGREFLSA